MRTTCLILILLCLCSTSAFTAEPAHHAQTIQSARVLLQTATYTHRDGSHIMLLRALRQLRDAKLQPLFQYLAGSSEPSLRLHGILALAEIADQPTLRSEHVARADNPQQQWVLIRHGLSAGLIRTPEIHRMMSLESISLKTQMLLASALPTDSPLDPDIMQQAVKDPDLMTASIAAMTLASRDDKQGFELLRQLSQTENPHRDSIRTLLIDLAMENQRVQLGPWILEVAQDARASDALALGALKAATHLGAPDALAHWLRRFESADTPADRLRLSMHALESSQALEPAFFERLKEDRMPTIKLCGEIGLRITQKRDASEPIQQLIQQNNPLAARWALLFMKTAPLKQLQTMTTQLITTAEASPDPVLFRDQRLSAAIKATSLLAKRDLNAQQILRPLLAQAPVRTRQAILMGLLNVPASTTGPIRFDHSSQWKDRTTEAMATLLQCRDAQKLDHNQLEQLGLISRGTGGLNAPLRLQASWVYLSHTEKQVAAIQQVLSNTSQP